MIPATELRIGNWTFNAQGEYSKINSGIDIGKSDALAPIPVSDNLLEKAGFVFHDYFKLWQLKRNHQMNAPEIELDPDYNVRDFGHRFIGVKITSLHQLQNLFFMLKGLELEMTEPAV
jgi:hypothetical protein